MRAFINGYWVLSIFWVNKYKLGWNMISFLMKFFPVTMMLLLLFASNVQAQSNSPVAADVIVVIDESGSMSGEQSWIREVVPLLENSLLQFGIGSEGQANEYGLVGYGSRSVVPRSFNVGDDLLGSADEFITAAQGLVINGGTEDGWRGIQFALDQYPRRNGAAVNIILATDEDRDNTQSSITFDTVLTALGENRALLNAVINARIRCEDGTNALGMDSQGVGYIADGSGGFTTCTNPRAISGSGATIAHYVDLALQNGGAAWDLSFLRRGGLVAESFTAAILSIKVDEILNQRPTGDLVAVAQATPNPAVAGQAIALDGSNSFHLIEGRSIISWEWDLDNDGTFDVSGPLASTSFPVLGEFPVTLRVIDDSETPLSAEATIVINVNTPPLQPTADAGGPYLFCPQNTPWRLDGRGSINPDDGLSEPGSPADSITAYRWDLDNDLQFDDASGDLIDATTQLQALGLGDHLIRLQVEDNTAISFPSSGQSNLTDTSVTQVRVRDASDALCNCLSDLAARPKFTKVQLTWTDSGANQYAVYRSLTEGGPYTRIAVTDSRFSTYLDLGLELDTPYFYVVAELDNAGREVCRSREITATPTARRFNVNNRPPQVTSTPVTAATEGVAYSYDVDATDPDPRERLSFSLQVAPTGMIIDASTGVIDWTPINAQVGEQTVIVRVADNQGLFAEQVFSINVANVNQAPIISSVPPTEATELQQYSYQVIGIDPDIGDVLTYGLNSSPSGMTIDVSSGLINWTPAEGQAGNQSVTVVVSDTSGLQDAQSFTINVIERNFPPAINSTPVTQATVDELYAYQVSATDANAADVITYSLGTFPEGMTINPSTGLINWTPTAQQTGANEVVVVVSDTRNAATSQSFNVFVAEQNQPPVFSITSLPDATEDQAYSFTVTATDPNASDTLTFSIIAAPAALNIDPQTGLIQWLPVNGNVGSNNVTLRVSDAAGLFAEQTFTITVANVNDEPLINSEPVLSADEGVLYSYQVTVVDVDTGDAQAFSLPQAPAGMTISNNGLVEWTPTVDQVGNQPVTIRVTDNGGLFQEQSFTVIVTGSPVAPQINSSPVLTAQTDAVYQYQVLASDGNNDALVFSLDVAPAGMSIDPVSGLIAWQPTEAQVGTQNVVVRVTDATDLFDTQSFSVGVNFGNRAPTINSSPLTTAQEDALYQYDVNAADLDGDGLLFSLTVAPSGMTIDPNSGLISWTPINAQLGDNTVTVEVSDGNGGDDSQSFVITVTAAPPNQSPVFNSTPSSNAIVDELYSYNAQASDPESDPLTFSLSVAPAGMTVNANTGAISWTPNQSQLGANSVVVRVDDDEGGFATQSFNINVIDEVDNQPPQITSAPPGNAEVDTLYTYDVNATDPNNDTLTFSLTTAPAGMSINVSSGLLSWTPNSTQTGDNPVVVRVDDGNGGFATQSFTIVVLLTTQNEPPTITSSPSTSAEEGSLYSYAVIASDVNGDTLSFSLTVAPVGMTIDAVSGLLSWTPTAAQLGLNDVAIRVDDGNGAFATQTFSINVISAVPNSPPQINSVPVVTATVGFNYEYTVIASDVDNDTLSFSLTVAPVGMTIDAASGVISWVPEASQVGSQSVVVRASDAESFVEQSFPVNVTAELPAFDVQVIISPEIADPDQVVSIQVQVAGATSPAITVVQDTTNLPVTNNTASFSATAPGAYPITVTVLSADGRSQVVDSFVRVRDASDSTAPTAIIATPTEQQQLMSLTDVIGTVSDANLFEYRLLIAPSGTNQFAELVASNNEVLNASLGAVDASMLSNGLYRLALIAEDINGLSSQDIVDIQVDGELKPGVVQLSFTDMIVPLAGIPITIERNYDSRVKTGRDLGIGWNLEVRQGRYTNNREPGEGWDVVGSGGFFNIPCSQAVELADHVTEVRISDREFYEFRPVASFSGFGSLIGGGCLGQMSFTQVDGIPGATLVPLESSNVVYLNGSNTITYDLGDDRFGDPWEPTRVRLTTIDGREFDVDINAGIRRIGDSSGGQLFISNSGVTNSAGAGVQFVRDGQGRIIQIIDPLGNSVAYQYDANGDLVSFSNQLNETTAYQYFAAIPHHLESIRLPDGRLETSFDYDPSGRVTESCTESGCVTAQYDLVGRSQTSIDATGRSVTYVYDDEGNVISQTDGLGNTVSYVYDTNGNVIQETDPEGNVTSQTWDANGNLLSVTEPFELGEDPADFTTSYTYDANGNVLTINSPTGAQLTSTYDATGNILSQTLDGGFVIGQYTYDAAGRPATETGPFGELSFSYNSNGFINTITDESGIVTDFTHDGAGKVTSYTRGGITANFSYDAMGRETSFNYSDGLSFTQSYGLGNDWTSFEGSTIPRIERELSVRGAPQSIMQIDGSSVDWEYDAAGRVITEVDALGGRTSFTYDAAGRLSTETDPMGNTTTYEMDRSGRVTAVVSAETERTEFSYYPNDQRRSMTDGSGRTWSFSYTPTSSMTIDPLLRNFTTETNSQGLVTRMVNPDGTDQRWTYLAPTAVLDGTDLPTSFTDEAGRVRNYSYDAEGRLISATDYAGQLADYSYGTDGLSTIEDAEGETISFTYDSFGDIASMTLGDGAAKQFAYNASREIASVTLSSGTVKTLAYDTLGRIVSDQRGSSESFSFIWDASSNLLSASDALGTANFTYNANGNITSFESSAGATVDYAYDGVGRITSQIISNSAATTTQTTQYEYDGAGRLTRITDPNSGITDFSYDAAGRLISRAMPNGITTSYTYNLRDQIMLVEHTNGSGAVISSVSYTRNIGGEPSRVTWQDGSFVDINYDSALRVIDEQFFDASSTLSRRIQYEYDLVGNRTARIVDGVRTDYSYAAGHRLQSATGGETQSYSYDADGRVSSIDRSGLDAGLSHNFAGQISSVALAGGSTIDYEYDHAGRRIAASDASNSRRFLTVPSVAGGLDNPQAILDASDNIMQSYVYAGDAPLQRTDGSTTVYYLTDGLGSVIGITDAAGNLLGSVKYDAFGGQLDQTGDMSLPAAAGGDFRFHGQWQEAATGLYHVRARDYDPVTGRFLSADPAEPDLREPESLNRYLFANANPYLFSDPTGRFTLVSVNISINIQATLRSIAVNIAKDYLIDKARSIIGSLVLSALKNFTALSSFNPWGFIGVDSTREAGRIWEQKIQDFICSTIPDTFREIVWFEPTISGGFASANGFGCPGGGGAFAPAGSSKPDFMLSKTEPKDLGRKGKRRIKAYLIGESKLSLTTFYNAYVKNGGYNKNQFNQIIRFAKDRVYSRTAVFLALYNGGKKSSRRNQAELSRLLAREAVKKGVVPIMVSAF